MKALTLYPEWLPLILEAATDPRFKTVENRTWPPWPSVIGHDIALHAGKVPGPKALQQRMEDVAETCLDAGLSFEDFVRVLSRPLIGSAIVAVVRVAGFWVKPGPMACPLYFEATKVSRPAISRNGLEAPRWWFPDQYGWKLENIRPLPSPIVCKGAMGLWELTPELERAVLEHVR